MEILLAAETVVLVLMAILVAGLLRSHAEILRRLDAGAAADDRESEADLVNAPERGSLPRGFDIAGKTLSGDAVKLAMTDRAPTTLLAFLTSGCTTCKEFWDAFRPDVRPEIPGDARLVVVTKDSSHESPSKLRKLAPPDVPVIMSSAAWDDYEVPTAPYFIYVEGRSGEIHGEGAAETWSQVLSLLADAIEDTGNGASTAADRQPRSESEPGSRSDSTRRRRRSTGEERALRIDRDLAAAGIGPGHPSLYPPDEEEPDHDQPDGDERD